MTVQFDQSGFQVVNTSAASPITISGVINVGAGSNGTSNRALIFAVCFPNAAAGTITGVSVTWNGTSMTSIISQSTTVSDTLIFGLVAPATGANNFVLTWTGSAGNRFHIAALSVVGADQTGGATTFAHSTSGTGSSSPASVTVTSSSGNICFAMHTIGSSFTTASGTDIGHDNGGNIAANASNWDTGAATRTLTYTCGSGTWKSLGVDIVATGGGGGGITYPELERSIRGLMRGVVTGGYH